ncbi:MAG: succinate dehydrogenase membrane anchor subunit, partial [Aeromonas sobria]
DYIKPVGLRGALQFALVVVLFVYLMTGFVVLWGV